YLTTKGYMKPVVGNVWNLSYALPTITWQPPRLPDASCTQQIIQALEYEVARLTVYFPADFLFWGKSFQATARLALIADHLGRQELIPAVLDVLKQSFAYWTANGLSPYAAYETGWGGVINGAGAADPNVDSGNAFYNSHHAEYGYLLHGAAVIAKYDTAWWDTNRPFVTAFARDIGNPSTADPYFTVARCKDWFAGHSWASGISNGAGTRDQQSVGEAANAYYGLILFADVFGNTDLKNWARLLWATEVDGAQSYWHLYPRANDPDTPYPEAELRNLVTMGNVMDFQAGAFTFFGTQRSEIAAIQILPVTPINEGMYDTAWLNGVWNYVSPEMANPSVSDEWKALVYMAYGEVNPQMAMSRSTNITAWGGTTSQAYLIYHLATRKNSAGGDICTAAAVNPTGTFVILAPDGKFVSSSDFAPQLMANSTIGTRFLFTYLPNGGNIMNTVTDRYVTADPLAEAPLAATRYAAQAWENFKVVVQADGTYVMMASVNSRYITIDSTGALINNGATVEAAAKFNFIEQWYVYKNMTSRRASTDVT
ncbi:glycosyl hydrolase family 81-domain-containing protein, partial [Mycena belliarum]